MSDELGPSVYEIMLRVGNSMYKREGPAINLGEDMKEEYRRLGGGITGSNERNIQIFRNGNLVRGDELDSFQEEDIQRLSAYRLKEVFRNYLSVEEQNSGEGSNIYSEARTLLGRLLSEDSFLETFLREFSLNSRDDSVQDSSGEDSLDDGEVPF